MSQTTSPKDSAILNMLSGGLVSVIGVLLLVFGSPTKPGQRANALFLAFERLFGYEGTCGLFIAVGVIILGVGVIRFIKATRVAPPA